jgi:hypothetical protein
MDSPDNVNSSVNWQQTNIQTSTQLGNTFRPITPTVIAGRPVSSPANPFTFNLMTNNSANVNNSHPLTNNSAITYSQQAAPFINFNDDYHNYHTQNL